MFSNITKFIIKAGIMQSIKYKIYIIMFLFSIIVNFFILNIIFQGPAYSNKILKIYFEDNYTGMKFYNKDYKYNHYIHNHGNILR